ncbi:AroM family protein [Shouchella clausii]|uniref:AroM protein n=1 Tax=Shouchella clausii TaxID=79880 RepID=A0A268S4F1_SHOCL|nr:AroM family protein [Shouchella clausii]PAD44413.1 hypothetical protein CHH54_02040 [Bacillus sp. 7520-S]SPT79299.1 AroM protein [Niallia circulans]MBU8596090.1 AroM family protein [Shouchella clausii]MCM3549607.1 AroM family protein [Shouchella clausii]MCY1102874.1 AroM family protein [Shouchella clausii]
MKKIALVTIGQSPRVDMTPEMRPFLGADVEFVEAGALDSLSPEQIKALAPDPDEQTYVSRLRNGDSAKLSKQKLLPHLQAELQKVEKHVSSSIIVCTGHFPTIQHEKPLLFPDKILCHFVQAVIGDGTLGAIVPLEEQIHQLAGKWGDLPLVSEAATPYAPSDIEGAAAALKEQGATLLVLDCMGYTNAHKQRAQAATGLPVILARSAVARAAAELA